MKQSVQSRREQVDKASGLSVVEQCKLLSIHRSGFYYSPKRENDLNLELMRMIDEKHLLHPWLGVPRMTEWLREDKGIKVNHKRVERLFRLMGISAIGPKPQHLKSQQGGES